MSLDQVAIRIVNSVVAIAQVSPDRAQGCENRQENDDKFLHTVIPDFVSQKKKPHDETHHASPNGSDKLRYAERGKCRLIDCRCDRQSVVGLEICDGLLSHRSKDAIDRSIVVTVALQLRLHIGNYLIGSQSIVSVDWAIVWIISLCVITPCRIPVARIPVIPAAVHKDDPIVMASPPIAIVPLPLVIADPRILLATKSTSAEVVISCHITSTIDIKVSCPIDRQVSVAINDRVASCANVSVARPVLIAKRAHPGVLTDHRV